MLMQSERKLIAEYGRKMSSAGLCPGTSGNLSVYDARSGLMAVSPSGIDYFETRPEDVVVMELDGKIAEGERKPSSEWGLHAGFYRAKPDVGAVVHTHSVYCTVFAVLGREIEPVHYAMLASGVERVPCAPYRTFGTPELAEERAVLTGAGPVRLLRGYTAEVTSYTRGQGKISYQPAGYRPCAQQDEIVKRIGYDPERDLLHPTGSVFCSHGAGFEVKWDEVDRMAHLPLLDFSPKQEPEKPQRIVRSVAPGGAPELEKELLAIFERTYGQIKRRDVLPMMALRSQDKKELLARMEPAEEFVLVDGYNIIFAWDELKEIGRDSLDAARHVLMNLLCNYQGYRGCAVILVFDAYKVPLNLGTVEKYHNIFVVYTKEAETADSYIERVTYELRGRRKVRVATSDNLEQLIILGHGAERISAQHFHDEVYAAQAEIDRILTQNNQKNNA